MSVTASYSISEKLIEEMELSISITMTVLEWRALMRAVPSNDYVPNRVGQLIASALGDVARACEKQYSFPQERHG